MEIKLFKGFRIKINPKHIDLILVNKKGARKLCNSIVPAKPTLYCRARALYFILLVALPERLKHLNLGYFDEWLFGAQEIRF